MKILEFIKDFTKNLNKNEYLYICTLNRETKEFKQYYNDKNNLNSKKIYNFLYFKNNNEKTDVYLSLNPFIKLNNTIFRQKKYQKRIDYIFLDFDHDGLKRKNRAIEEMGKPTYLIQTSKDKFQLLYKFKYNTQNISINDIESIQKIIQEYFNSDNVFDSTRIFRLPYFKNNKNGFITKLLESNNTTYELKYFLDFLDKKNIKRDISKNPPKVEDKREERKKERREKEEIKNFSISNKKLEEYKRIYNIIKNKKNTDDLSTVDFTFIKRYKEELNCDIELICEVLQFVRPDNFEKHLHEYEYYISRKLEDIEYY